MSLCGADMLTGEAVRGDELLSLSDDCVVADCLACGREAQSNRVGGQKLHATGRRRYEGSGALWLGGIRGGRGVEGEWCKGQERGEDEGGVKPVRMTMRIKLTLLHCR